MSSNKKRKIEAGQGTPSKSGLTGKEKEKSTSRELIVDSFSIVLSAAALRRRLLERQASTNAPEGAASPAAVATAAEDEANSPSGDAAGLEPKRKVPVRGSVKKEASGTFEKMLLESAQVPAADDTYVVVNTFCFAFLSEVNPLKC